MREKILITVKTYPTLSKKYKELVCTAGINDSGEWRRLYPVRFRQLYEDQKYRKYQWVTADIEKAGDDNRPESYKIIHDSIEIDGTPLTTANKWSERKRHFLDKIQVHEDLTDLIAKAHQNQLSLAAFRPSRMIDFKVEETEREWDAEKLAILEREKKQLDLFLDEESLARQFESVRKLPYKFSYCFEDCVGKKSTLMIEDWEIGALYWNCLESTDGNEEKAVEKVRAKYWYKFAESGTIDLFLILGTTFQFHQMRSPNPFVIIGVFYPKKELQERLF